MNQLPILFVPAHYILADSVGSKPYVSYKLLETLPKVIYDVELIVIVGQNEIIEHGKTGFYFHQEIL